MPAGCLRIQLNSGITFPGLESDPIGVERRYKTTILPPTSDASHKPRLLPVLLICYTPHAPANPSNSGCQSSPGCSLCRHKSEAPWLPPPWAQFATTAHRTQEKPFYSLDYQFTTEGIKGHMSTARWRDPQGEGACVLVDLGIHKCSGPPTWKFSEKGPMSWSSWGFCGVSLGSHDWLIHWQLIQ